jgi:hypothetical protein
LGGSSRKAIYRKVLTPAYPLGATLRGKQGKLPPEGTTLDQVWNFTPALGGKDGKVAYPWLPPAKARPLNRYVTDPRSFQCPADGGWDFRANGGPVEKSLWETWGAVINTTPRQASEIAR